MTSWNFTMPLIKNNECNPKCKDGCRWRPSRRRRDDWNNFPTKERAVRTVSVSFVHQMHGPSLQSQKLWLAACPIWRGKVTEIFLPLSPLYFSLEVGTDGSIASGVVWSDREWLGDRAQFRPEAFPGWSRAPRLKWDYAESNAYNSFVTCESHWGAVTPLFNNAPYVCGQNVGVKQLLPPSQSQKEVSSLGSIVWEMGALSRARMTYYWFYS